LYFAESTAKPVELIRYADQLHLTLGCGKVNDNKSIHKCSLNSRKNNQKDRKLSL